MTVIDFVKAKNQKKLSMLTCYDYWSSQIISKSDVDAILVGDSAAMVMHGKDSTLEIDTKTLALHIQAVKRGSPKKLIIGDLPFLSYRKNLNESMRSVEILMKAGANAVKLEGAEGNLELIAHLVQSGIPVMGHLGLTPQFMNSMGGYVVQAKDKNSQQKLMQDSTDLEQAGCFSIVLECIPENIACSICKRLKIPLIGIGAGPHTDGQILVLQDMLGLNSEMNPRYLRKYLNGEELFIKAINNYCSDVKNKKFPDKFKESYHENI